MRFVSPHRSIINNSVSGTVSTGYQNSWLTNPSVGYPARTDGNLALTVSGVGLVDVVAVTHHNIIPAATVTAGSLGVISTVAWRPDNIPYNYVRVLASPTSPGSIALTVTGNGGAVVVGSLSAGESYVFPDFLNGRQYSPQEPFAWEGDFSSLAPYEYGIAAQRRVQGSIILTSAEWENLQLVFEAQRLGNRPVLWVEDDTVNDAWLCQLSLDATHNEGSYFVNLQIAEIPRFRWP